MKNVRQILGEEKVAISKKTFDGVSVTPPNGEELTVADAVKMSNNGYEFDDIKKGRYGEKNYIFNKR